MSARGGIQTSFHFLPLDFHINIFILHQMVTLCEYMRMLGFFNIVSHANFMVCKAGGRGYVNQVDEWLAAQNFMEILHNFLGVDLC